MYSDAVEDSRTECGTGDSGRLRFVISTPLPVQSEKRGDPKAAETSFGEADTEDPSLAHSERDLEFTCQ